MLKKLKNFLGIEGVKIQILVPESFDYDEAYITGQIILTSMSDQTVESIEVSLIEKYRRGRGDSVLINEYVLGHVLLKEKVDIKKDEEKRIQFELGFVEMKSEMDKMEKDHFLFSAIVKTAKLIKGVKSTYRVQAKANMKGISLSPTVTSSIKKA